MGKPLIFHGFNFKPYLHASFKEFLPTSMFFLVNSFWSYIVRLLAFIFGKFSRSSSGGENAIEETGSDGIERRENPKMEIYVGSVSNTRTSKYEFSSGNCVFRFIQQPQTTTTSFTVQEMFVIPHDQSPISQDFVEDDSLPDTCFPGCSVDSEDVSPSYDLVVDSSSSEYSFSDDQSPIRQDFVEDHSLPDNRFSGFSVDLEDVSPSDDLVVDSSSSEYSFSDELNEEEEVVKQGKTETPFCGLVSEEHELYEKGEIVNEQDRIVGENEVHSSRNSSDDFWASIYECDDFSSYDHDHEFDSDSDEISCDKSVHEALQPETPMGIGDKRVDYDEGSPSSLDEIPPDQSISHLGDVIVENIEADSRNVEMESHSIRSVIHAEEHIPRDEFSDSDDEIDQESSTFENSKGINALKRCDGEGDQTGEDVLLEQKELIRQMKREMRNLKISGLPTILEESEPPRVEDDLRPLKIDERIGHKDRMDEIQTLHRMYLDKMRKLDILSQQTMYAIGLLQLKNQDHLASNRKIHVPVIKSLLAQNFWSHKFRKHEADPLQKLIRGFQRDLEVVYVGQVCLSWETLKWQHHKAQQLHAHDPEGFRQHNQVAGEFQKFQVLLQRFTEDEPFHHGPRVQHYVKSRCALPDLLQVPLIKDDPRSERRGKGEGGISIEMLKEVIGASMRAFWGFLRVDKDEVHGITLMGLQGPHAELQDPSDMDLFVEICANLQKKEKRLKDLVKSGNCIVKKLQKHRDHQLSHELFLAQVELRLVSRVLSMSRLTTDQILWCHKKVSKINIVGRKIYLESSFLLFPC